MKKLTLYVLSLLTCLFCACASNNKSVSADCAKTKCCLKAKKSVKPRKIGVQMYTFRKFTFEESVPMLTKNGIYGLGITAGQNLTKKYPKLRFGPHMNAEQRKWFKDFVKANKCELVSFGVTNPTTENEIKNLCAFAKEMGIPMILTECKPHLMPVWDKYCEEYGIKMAVHNHAANSRNNYYNPITVRNMVAPYKNVGACPDNGHWSRSGIDSVWGFKVLEGETMIIHFKDQLEFGNVKNQPVPFGTGDLDMKAILAELDRQGFDGYFLIEYEAKWDNNLPEVVQCANYLKNN